MCIKFSILKPENNYFNVINTFNDNQLDIAINYFNDYKVEELLQGEKCSSYSIYYESKGRRIIIKEKKDLILKLERI